MWILLLHGKAVCQLLPTLLKGLNKRVRWALCHLLVRDTTNLDSCGSDFLYSWELVRKPGPCKCANVYFLRSFQFAVWPGSLNNVEEYVGAGVRKVKRKATTNLFSGESCI
jgi:hypothetical protein